MDLSMKLSMYLVDSADISGRMKVILQEMEVDHM